MKKNKDFFYLQYNQINWKNQEKTKINSYINKYIIKNVISEHKGEDISIFDIGLGIGFFVKMFYHSLISKYKNIKIEGCEPSTVNYQYFLAKKPKRLRQGVSIETQEKKYLEVRTDTKFDYITAIYVFPHFVFDELETVAQKIHSMLKEKGRFILVLANEQYLKTKLETEKDLFIESGMFAFNGKQYKEVLHYSEIPKIGKVIDYNREEQFYIDLFTKNKFVLNKKEDLNDNGFICSLFIFEKLSTYEQ
ncbi:MAG: class I SAM-dependent methyltransferase [Candidatus Paceibacterota bacterium]|jgi:SAM-dependent methyltransferase